MPESLKISEAKLLSLEEYENLIEKGYRIPEANFSYWISTKDDKKASVNGISGQISEEYCDDDFLLSGIRPILKMENFSNTNLKIGDCFLYGEKTFTIISEDYAFCNEHIGNMPCKYCKEYLDSFFEEAKNTEIEILPAPLEIKYRYDFTNDLTEVCMIDGDNINNYKTDEEKEEFLSRFSYLKDIEHFISHVETTNGERISVKNFNKDSRYIDFVTKGIPKNENEYLYQEYFEDEYRRRYNIYEGVGLFKDMNGEKLYDMPDTCDVGYGCHTRTIANKEVIYDWRHEEDYVPAHHFGDEIIGAHHIDRDIEKLVVEALEIGIFEVKRGDLELGCTPDEMVIHFECNGHETEFYSNLAMFFEGEQIPENMTTEEYLKAIDDDIHKAYEIIAHECVVPVIHNMCDDMSDHVYNEGLFYLTNIEDYLLNERQSWLNDEINGVNKLIDRTTKLMEKAREDMVIEER